MEGTMSSEAIAELLTSLKAEKIFFGTVSYIQKIEKEFIIHVDLLNQLTEKIDHLTYTFGLVIETTHLSVLGQKNELFQFTILDKPDSQLNTYEATISFTVNYQYDKINPFPENKVYIKVLKASPEKKQYYKDYIQTQIDDLNQFIKIEQHYHLPYHDKSFSQKIGIQYSQYHVGFGNSSYINLGGITRGFFNIGFSLTNLGKNNPYTGFSRHKPDWIILSNLNKNFYSAAVRYGNDSIFSCVWILPFINDFHPNLIRLLYAIKDAKGSVIMLKYKANSSVCSFVQNDAHLEIYYDTDNVIHLNNLSLYIKHQNQFIFFGNSDYNFLTKSLVKQNFDTIVVPYKGSPMKTKIYFNHNPKKKYSARYRNGFQIHRTDLSGNYKCKI